MNQIFALWLFTAGMGSAHLSDHATNELCETRGKALLGEFTAAHVGAFYFCLANDVAAPTSGEVLSGVDGKRWLRIDGKVYDVTPPKPVVVPAKKAAKK